MFLDSLGVALERLGDGDVSMAEPEDDTSLQLDAAPADWHQVPEPQAPSRPETEPKEQPEQIELINAPAALAPVLAPASAAAHHPLWPTALGAHTATHLELRMPIPPPWHENIYYTVSTYIHLLFKGCVLGVVLWIFAMLVRDVNTRIGGAVVREMASSAQCGEEFALNDCQNPRPALVQLCRDLEQCMDRDPLSSVFRLSALAQSLAETLNSFTDPLSPKSLGFLVAALGLFIYFTNFAFGFVRARAMHEQREPAHATLIYK